MAMNQRSKKATESVAFIAVIAATVVLLNALGIFVFGRIDMTSNKLFSLSSGSKRVVESLEDELTVTAYFTKDLPPPFNATERYVRDLLDEYKAAGGGKVVVKFVNPDTDEARSEAEAAGAQRVAHQKIENDAVQVVEGYRGVVFEYLGERRAIPAVSGTEGLEYDITQTLKQLTGEKLKLGLLGGHEGPTLEKGLSTLKAFLPTYDIVSVDAKQPIDEKLKALLVVAPENALTDDELRNIDAYVMKGGNLGVFGGTVKVKQDEQQLGAEKAESGVNRLLSKWGVSLGSELVADAQCGQAPMRTQFGISIPVSYPPVPVVNFDEEQASHPIAYRLEQLFVPFGVSLTLNDELRGDKDVQVRVLGRTSKRSWLLEGDNVDLKVRQPREWSMSQKRGPFAVAVAVEGKLPSAFRAEAVSSTEGAAPQGPRGPERAAHPVHVFVSGASGFLRDEFLPPARPGQQQELNATISFGLNVVDWLAQEDELIAIRAKSVEDPLLEVPASVKEAEIEANDAAKAGDESGTQAAIDKRKEALVDWDAKKAQLKLLNIALIPLLFIAFGLVRWQMRKKRRANISL
jgi:ABC-2 type transport system permease protein